jgi:subtilisin-like proprotein convertase family protein
VSDVNITLNITHTYVDDLNITLINPAGTQVLDVNTVGSSSNNFTNTVLDDEASTSIAAGIAPYTGTFRPSNSMTAFDGGGGNGSWTLRIVDNVTGDTGTLNSWSISLTTNAVSETSTVTDANGDYVIAGLTPGTNRVRQVLPALWNQTLPATNAAHVITTVTGITETGRDFGSYTNNVNVTVTPSSVVEDDIANLIYTFTHAGLNTSPLTVSFAVTGTASAIDDYIVLGATTFSTATGTGTIVIPANATTATITIDPSANAIYEPSDSHHYRC